jgi:hypothetical protein
MFSETWFGVDQAILIHYWRHLCQLHFQLSTSVKEGCLMITSIKKVLEMHRILSLNDERRSTFKYPIMVIVTAVFLTASMSLQARGQTIFDAQSPVHLHLDAVYPEDNASVSFSITPAGVIENNNLASVTQKDSEDHSYSVLLDLLTLGRDKSGRFSFSLYVKSNSTNDHKIYQFLVDEDSNSRFNDTIQAVNFQISSASSTSTGVIDLPLHCAFGNRLALDYKPSSVIQQVPLGGPFSFPIRLTSNLKTFGATLGDATVTAGCKSCWQPGAQATLSKAEIAPNDTVDVTLNVIPSTLHDLAATATQLASDKSHDVLSLNIKVATDKGGYPADQTIYIPVRFTPPLPYLLLAIFLGALAGGLVRAFLASGADTRRQLLIGFVIAVVVELLAIVLFATTSTQVKVAGFNFDPTQVLPAVVLCLLVGGGPALIKYVKEAFKTR